MLAEGEFALVREHLEVALTKPSIGWAPFGDHEFYALLADAAAQQRDAAALRRYTPLAEETAQRYGHTLYQAIAQRTWGVAHRLAGDYAEAETRLLGALDLFRSLETRWQIGRTLFELGELALDKSDAAMARSYYDDALQAFIVMKAVPDEVRTRAVLERLGGGEA